MVSGDVIYCNGRTVPVQPVNHAFLSTLLGSSYHTTVFVDYYTHDTLVMYSVYGAITFNRESRQINSTATMLLRDAGVIDYDNVVTQPVILLNAAASAKVLEGVG